MNHSQFTARRFTAIAILFLAATWIGLAPAASTTPGVFAADKGKLKIVLDGQVIGSENFDITASGAKWTARGTTTLKDAGGSDVHVDSTLVLSPAGIPLTYEWASQSGKKIGAHIVFENGVAKMAIQVEGFQPFLQEFTFDSPLVAILDNNVYHHYAVLARVYDWSKGGTQTFPVLIPQDRTPGSITVEPTGMQTVDGNSFAGLRVSTADLEVLVYVDAGHRLMRLDVPSAKVSVVRE